MVSKAEFLRKFSRDLLDGSGAAFVGAGMSIASGMVSWSGLLSEIADDLGLNLKLEHDLISVAQYEFNRQRTRDSIETAIIRNFCRDAELQESHRLLARLPIESVWTTNYDGLLEKAFRECGKQPDVKHNVDHLRQRRPYSDVTIFKMHGDVDDAANAVLTKTDYECYELERGAFTVQLLSDLLSKRFVFLGFSFTDPNLEYMFNRLRRLLNPFHREGRALRDHYCILRRPGQPRDPSDAAANARFEHESRRFEHRVLDLQNYGIQTVAIDRHSELEEMLLELNRRVRTRAVMISGAVESWEPLGEGRLNACCRNLAHLLIEENFDIISGVGKGISGGIMVGAHEALAHPGAGRIGRRIRLFPFPYWLEDSPQRDAYSQCNRLEMASQAGVTLVIAGNRRDPVTQAIVSSPGVAREVELARQHGQLVIPIGATGHAAQELYQKVMADPQAWFPGLDVVAELKALNEPPHDGESDSDFGTRMAKTTIGLLKKIQATVPSGSIEGSAGG